MRASTGSTAALSVISANDFPSSTPFHRALAIVPTKSSDAVLPNRILIGAMPLVPLTPRQVTPLSLETKILASGSCSSSPVPDGVPGVEALGASVLGLLKKENAAKNAAATARITIRNRSE